MIEIAAAVCMISTPKRCRDITLTFDVDVVTPIACAMNGQIELSKWTADHPAWRIAKFSCRAAGQVAKL